MRNTFIKDLISHARSNEKIALVVGDLGYSVIEPFEEEFPDRFINAGVAEQNMAGMAAFVILISMSVLPNPAVQLALVLTLRRASLLSLHAVLLGSCSVQAAYACQQLRQTRTPALV